MLRAEIRQLHGYAHERGRAVDELDVALIDGVVVSSEANDGGRPPLHGSPEQIVEGLLALGDAGLDHLVAGVRLAGASGFDAAIEALDVVAAEVLPHIV
jgi:hypothetical protein